MNKELENLYEDRLIVLLEGGGKFRQVALTHEQFKKVGDIIVNSVRTGDDLKPGHQEVSLELTEDWEIDADLFLGLDSYYEDEEKLTP